MNTHAIETLLNDLGEHADREGRNSLDDNQMTVLTAWWSKGVIDNGGFRRLVRGAFADGPPSLKAVARAFRALGFEGIAFACAAVEQELFGVRDADALPPAAYHQLVQGLDCDQLREHDRVVFGVSYDDLLAAIGKYIAPHPSSFGLSSN